MKSINWPADHRQQIIDDAPSTQRCAVRLGRLYYDNQFWCDGETIFLRANHKIIRQAKIIGDLKCCTIGDLTATDIEQMPGTVSSPEAVADYLQQTYSEHYKDKVSAQTQVTVVYYAPEPFDPELLEYEDDPHM